MVVVYKSADICDTNIILTSSHSVLDIREVVFLFNEFGVSFQPSFVNYCVFTIYHRLMCTGKKNEDHIVRNKTVQRKFYLRHFRNIFHDIL